MTQPIQGTTSATGTSTTQPTNPAGIVDENMFLKLLIAQVQHQDPTQPTDSTAWLGQMAQFSTVEQLTNMAKTSADSASAGKVGQAVSLIGHAVSYLDSDGQAADGTVQSVDITQSGPTLTISGQAGIDLGSVTEVR